MKKPYQKSAGGWKGAKKPGAAGAWKKDRGAGGARPQMHGATCSSCGDKCEVPFMPNGKKPIFCSQCFTRDEEGAPQRSYKKDFGGQNNDQVTEQLKAINAKLESILRVLQAQSEE